MSPNLQRAEENGDNISSIFMQATLQPKLKVIIIGLLLHLTISYNALSVLFNSVSVIVNL